MSLDMAVMNLKKEYCLGLAYVAVSRIRKAGGVNFLELFDFEHFKHKESDMLRDRELDFRMRSNQLL
jgi:hypothetical protein